MAQMVRSMLVLVLVAIAVPAVGQVTTASIRGTVTDTTGAIVPGATVTVKADQTGFTRETATNASGFYSFAELPLGTYTIEVTLTGFKSASRTGIVRPAQEIDR